MAAVQQKIIRMHDDNARILQRTFEVCRFEGDRPEVSVHTVWLLTRFVCRTKWTKLLSRSACDWCLCRTRNFENQQS